MAAVRTAERSEHAPCIRRSAADSTPRVLPLKAERDQMSPSPPERPTPDPDREEYPRDRDKSSSEQVAKRSSGPTGTPMNTDDPEHRMRSAERPDRQAGGSGCRRSGPEPSATA